MLWGKNEAVRAHRTEKQRQGQESPLKRTQLANQEQYEERLHGCIKSYTKKSSLEY